MFSGARGGYQTINVSFSFVLCFFFFVLLLSLLLRVIGLYNERLSPSLPRWSVGEINQDVALGFLSAVEVEYKTIDALLSFVLFI